MNTIISWVLLKIYRLNLHFDLVLVSRWKWRKCFTRGSRVLEIGPGGGPWTLELLERNNTVTVVDLDISSLLRLKRKLRVFPLKCKKAYLINSHAKNLSLREKYDQIIVFEVLEHIMEDELTLANLVRHLSPAGEILISTPSSDHIPIEGEVISPREDGRHVRKGYSFEGFEAMLNKFGMEIRYRDTASGWFTRRLTSISNAVYRFTSNRLLFFLTGLISRPLARLDTLRPGYEPYCIFLIAARKSKAP